MKKLPQNFIKDVHIEFNKIHMNFTLEELFMKKFGESNNFKLENNIKIIKKIRQVHKNFPMLKMTLKEILEKYFESETYKEDLQKLRKKESEEYCALYDAIAKDYINYFMNQNGNKHKIYKQSKKNGKSVVRFKTE